MKSQIFRRPLVQLSLLVCLMDSVRASSRQWQEIVDHSIASKSNLDSSRYELKIEADPFLKPAEKNPSKIPTESQQEQQETGWNLINSLKPQNDSVRPSANTATGSFGIKNTGASFAVKESEEIPPQSSGCENGVKYELHMKDTWGDGWDKTMITITGIDRPTSSMETVQTDSEGDSYVSISKTITLDSPASTNTVGQIFQGSLQQGFHDFKEVCLLYNQCYQLTTTGGEFSDEVSWELRPKSNDPGTEMAAMLIGGASTGCIFSPPDETGLHFCPNTCSDEIHANAAPPTIVENVQPEETGDIVEAEARFTGTTGAATVPNATVVQSMPVGFASASASLGSSKSASAIWNKFRSGTAN